MGFLTAVTDVQDSTGASVVVPNPDGTRPQLVVKLGSGLAATFAKSGDQGIVTVSVATTPPPPTQVAAAGSVNLLPSGLVVPSTPGIYVLKYEVKAWALGEGSAIEAGYYNRLVLIEQGPSGSPIAAQAESFGVVGGPFVAQSSPYTSAPASAGVANTLSGSTLHLVAYGWPTPTAFSSGGTYAGGAAMVTNDTPSRLYYVQSGGTDSSSGGPTGTGPTVTVGGLTYVYVGLAATKPWFQLTNVSIQ